jgi:uncharacterized membrane protein
MSNCLRSYLVASDTAALFDSRITAKINHQMTPMIVLGIFIRWLHVITACVLIGCAFFSVVLLPIALRGLDSDSRLKAVLAVRRPLKMVVHPGILLLLLTGAYNAWRNWPIYNQWPGITHGIFGMHLLLGLAVMTLQLVVLTGRNPKPSGRSMMKWALILAFLTVLAGSTLKWARERAHDPPKLPPTAAIGDVSHGG